MANEEIPIEKVEQLKRRGLTKDEIVRELENQEFNYQQINDALEQSDIKQNVKRYPDYPEITERKKDPLQQLEEAAPSPSGGMEVSSLSQPVNPIETVIPNPVQDFKSKQLPIMEPSFQGRGAGENTEALVESIIKEKWDELVGEVGDIKVWKESLKNDIDSIKQEVLRVEERFDGLQRSLAGKIQDYSKGINDMGADIHALENVLQKIITPLTTNIKELNKITKELKSTKRSRTKKK